MNMDAIVDAYVDGLQADGTDTYALAGIAYEDFSDYRAVVNSAVPRDVFVDMLASLYWMYVASSGLSAGEAAVLAENITDQACTFFYDEQEEAEFETLFVDGTPAEKFGELSQEFFDDLKLFLGENVEALTGIVWNGHGGDDVVCSVRNNAAIGTEDLASLVSAQIITMIVRGSMTPEQARETLKRAGEELERWLA